MAKVRKDKVCDLCGDIGFAEDIVICFLCNQAAEHVYCMKDKLFHVPKRWACEVCLTRVKTEPADDHSSSPLRISQEEVRGSKVRFGGQQLSQTSRSKGVQMSKVKFIPTEEVIKLKGINVRTTSCTQTPSSKRVPPALTSTKPPIPSGRKENMDSSCTRSGRPHVTGNLNPSSRCPGRSQNAQLFVSSSKLIELPESRHEEKDSLEADRTSEKDSSTMPCEKEHANGDVSNREVGMPDIQANEASPAGTITECKNSALQSEAAPPTLLKFSLWRGDFEVLEMASCHTLYEGISARPLSTLSDKAYEASKKIPVNLQLELLPFPNVWPKLFRLDPPHPNDISLIFSPTELNRPNEKYISLLDTMERQDLAMRCQVGLVELLIFTSKKLSQVCQRLDAPMFLWGVFRQMKNKRPPPPLPTTRHLSSHIDSDSQPNIPPSVGSSEVEDMEIDMIGGILIGNIDNVVKKPIVLEMGNAIDSHGSPSVERRRVSFKIDKPSPSRKCTMMDQLEPKLPFSSQGCSEQAASGCQDGKKRVKKVIEEEMADYDDMSAPPGFPEPLHGEQNYGSLGAAKKAEETQQAENKVNSNLDKEPRSPEPMSKESFVLAPKEPVRFSGWSPRQVSDPQKSRMRSTIGSPTWTEWDKRHKSATGSSSDSSAGYRCVRHSELGEIKSSANIKSWKKEDARIIDMSKLQEKSCVVSDRANQILSRAHALNSDLRSSLERDGEQKSFSRFFGPCVNDASPTFKSYYSGISPAVNEVQKKQAMDADSSNLQMTSNQVVTEQVASVCQDDKRLVKKVIKEEIGDYDDLFAPPGFPEPQYREPNYSSLGAAKKAEETQRAEDRVNSNSDKETRSPEPMSSRRASKGSFVPAPGEPVRYSNWSPRQVPDSQKSPMMCSTFGSPTWPEREKKHKSSTGSSSNSSAGYHCARDSELGEIKSSANIRSRKEGARIIDMSKLQEKSHVVSDCANQILSRARAPNSDLRPSMERDGGQKSISRLFGPCDNDASPRCESYYRGISLAADEVQKKHVMDSVSSNLPMKKNQVSDQGRSFDPKKSSRTSMHPPDGASNFPSAKPLPFRSPTRPATNQFMIWPRPTDYPDSKAKGPM
ncbi:hypothetical protein QJS04_geneDACA008011 [Acorus gramineus]|uniref:AIPP2-like SPOC-like domain-containing protein n=1 Tax=Acorus gramineus TaxID=55184 RepID=A0AAV9B817_ACOGR|nr:hypothetical protein QJS04_geneDACA008011 [Acorus gramineus]